MVLVKIGFNDSQVPDISIFMPNAPKDGDIIQFPEGAVKLQDGSPHIEDRFYVTTVEWVLKENAELSALAFSHVYIEVA